MERSCWRSTGPAFVSKRATVETAGTVDSVYAVGRDTHDVPRDPRGILAPMDIETTFDILSSPVRRTIIAVLHESDPIDRRQLTATLVGLEIDADAGDEDALADARRRIRVGLHHNHLPRLADGDLISYDDETVTATAELDEIAQAVPLPDVDERIAATQP